MWRYYRQSVAGLPRNLWVLFWAVLVNHSGTMVLPFLTLYLSRELGIPHAGATTVVSVYGAGILAASLAGGVLTDRLGARRVMVLSMIGAGVLMMLLALARSYGAVVVMTFALSLATGMFRPPVMAAAATLVPPEAQPRAMALIRWAINMGMTIGPAVGGFLAAWSYEALFFVDGATSIAAGLVLLAFYTEARGAPAGAPAPEAAPAPAARSPWRNPDFRVFLLVVFGVGLIAYQHLATLPLYVRFNCGLPESFFGLLVAFNTSLVILFELPIVPWLQRRRRTSIMAAGTLLFGLGYGLYGLSGGWAALLAATLVWTAGEIVLLPLASAHAAAMAPPELRGRYMGAYMTAFGASFILAPLLGGPVLDRWGAGALWGGCLALGALLTAALLAARPGEESLPLPGADPAGPDATRSGANP
jgi:MFS family permease